MFRLNLLSEDKAEGWLWDVPCAHVLPVLPHAEHAAPSRHLNLPP